MRKYFFTDGVNKFGPFSKEELRSQKIKRNTLVWYYGLDNWMAISEIGELADIISTIPPEYKPLISKCESAIHELTHKTKNNNALNHFELMKSKPFRWIVGVLALFFISFILIKLGQRHSEENLYNEIVENSYDGDEKFDIYIEKFYRDLGFYGIFPKRPKTTIIRFSRLDQLDNTTHIHGLSFGKNDDNKIEIYINPASWQRFNKPMRYFLMYHELAHDVLNLDDLDNKTVNEGKLMFPEISSYESKNMDDFIESFHALFEEHSKK